MTAEPRFHTPRDPRYPSLGGKVDRVSRLLGRPLVTWQRRAVDVLTEVGDNGRPRYHTGIITVPRQSGKTAVVLGLALHRALSQAGSRTWMTAQTGQAARERFLLELAEPAVRVAPQLVRLNKGAGDTRLVVPATGAQIRPHPPNDQYLHGEQSDLNLLDETWSFTEAQGKALLQAIIPTQNTRPAAQTIMLSTEGDADSTWWHRIVDEARDGKPGVCIIDYGVRLGEDPADVDAVTAAHPAVGEIPGVDRNTIVRALDSLGPAEFGRAYANVRTRTVREPLLSAEVLDRVDTTDPIPAGAPVCIAAAVSWLRDETVIVAAAEVGGAVVVETIDRRPGLSWAPEVLRAVVDAQRPVAVVVDTVGPSRLLADQLDGVELLPLDGPALGLATDDFFDRLTAEPPTLRYRSDPGWRREWDGAATRVVSDVGRVLSRRHSLGSIATLEAALLAVHGLTRHTAPAPDPVIRF